MRNFVIFLSCLIWENLHTSGHAMTIAEHFCGLPEEPADLSTAKFILFCGPKYADNCIYDLDDYKSLLECSTFDRSKNTILYLHGHSETPEVESVRVIVEAYLMRNDLGVLVALKLLAMFENGLNIEKLHVVGHSQGGQLAGIIGREVYRRSKQSKQIQRISALDPAFPMYYLGGLINHLNRNDAKFVDIIHTDAWFYGTPDSTGTVDFWPNGGKTLQPGCPKRDHKWLSDSELCSHRRSWWFWAESVFNRFTDKFETVKANSWSDFKTGQVFVGPDSNIVMGHDCPTNISGDFFLQTNSGAPYARGKAGKIYVKP